MNVTTVPSAPGSRASKKRLGRGVGSGLGKTSTRGQKGQRSRSGSGKRPGFEGGRNPLIRRLPKRGFRQKATGQLEPYQTVNLQNLERYAKGKALGPDEMKAQGLIDNSRIRVKVLGFGKLSKALNLRVHAVSASAKSQIEKAGGSVELITGPAQKGRI